MKFTRETSLDEPAKQALFEYSPALVQNSAFASGRSARSFKERIIEAQSRRISADMNASLTAIGAEDIRAAAIKFNS